MGQTSTVETYSHPRSAPSHGLTEIARSAAILIVDDEAGMRNFLKKSLERHFALVEVAENVEEAESLRRRCHFDIMIVDVRRPGRSGLEWLQECREPGSRPDVIFVTAFADMDTAIGVLRAGAADLLLKPFRVEQMMSAVERCLERRRMARENFLLHRQVDALSPMEGIVGSSTAMQEMSAIVRRVAATGSTVLVQGDPRRERTHGGLCPRQLRLYLPGPAGERAVWPYARCLHRRADDARGPVQLRR